MWRKGQRISSETVKKPKPLIKIGKIAIIEHILKIFLKIILIIFIF